MKRGLDGTPDEHRRDAIKSQVLAKELIKSAAVAVRDGRCAEAVESLNAASVYLGASAASGSWVSDSPMRMRNHQLGRAHEAVLKKIIGGCIRPRIVR